MSYPEDMKTISVYITKYTMEKRLLCCKTRIVSTQVLYACAPVICSNSYSVNNNYLSQNVTMLQQMWLCC